MASDETSGVMMAYFMIGILRVAGVLASRRELQDKGVLEVDCPVCLGQLCGGEGRVIFHVLECGHRCEAARTGSFPAGDDAKVDHLPPPPPLLCVCLRIHQECLFQIARTPDAAVGVVRRCPVCRSTSRTRHSFVVKGAMA